MCALLRIMMNLVSAPGVRKGCKEDELEPGCEARVCLCMLACVCVCVLVCAYVCVW